MSVMLGKVPVTWDIDYVRQLAYTDISYREKVEDVVVNPIDLDRYGANGWIVDIARDFDLDHFADLLKELSWIKDPLLQVNRVRHGMTLPYHTDKIKYHTDRGLDIKDVVRVIVFLEEWKPGQHFEADFQNVGTWSAGDWVAFSPTTPHLSVNSGHHDRYALQITGTHK